MNEKKYKHNIIRNAKMTGLPYKNHAGKEVSPRKTGRDCEFISFLIRIEQLYRFQNTPNNVFTVCGCMKNCCQNFSDRDKSNLITFINEFANNVQDIYHRGLSNPNLYEI